jgi:hypothetical protein
MRGEEDQGVEENAGPDRGHQQDQSGLRDACCPWVGLEISLEYSVFDELTYDEVGEERTAILLCCSTRPSE